VFDDPTKSSKMVSGGSGMIIPPSSSANSGLGEAGIGGAGGSEDDIIMYEPRSLHKYSRDMRESKFSYYRETGATSSSSANTTPSKGGGAAPGTGSQSARKPQRALSTISEQVTPAQTSHQKRDIIKDSDSILNRSYQSGHRHHTHHHQSSGHSNTSGNNNHPYKTISRGNSHQDTASAQNNHDIINNRNSNNSSMKSNGLSTATYTDLTYHTDEDSETENQKNQKNKKKSLEKKKKEEEEEEEEKLHNSRDDEEQQQHSGNEEEEEEEERHDTDDDDDEEGHALLPNPRKQLYVEPFDPFYSAIKPKKTSFSYQVPSVSNNNNNPTATTTTTAAMTSSDSGRGLATFGQTLYEALFNSNQKKPLNNKPGFNRNYISSHSGSFSSVPGSSSTTVTNNNNTTAPDSNYKRNASSVRGSRNNSFDEMFFTGSSSSHHLHGKDHNEDDEEHYEPLIQSLAVKLAFHDK
jgi:hypothetical protein